MPTIEHRRYRDGELIETRNVEVTDEAPTADERIADLEAAYVGDTEADARVRERAAVTDDEPTRTR